jgi:hypothetical protein
MTPGGALACEDDGAAVTEGAALGATDALGGADETAGTDDAVGVGVSGDTGGDDGGGEQAKISPASPQ